MVDSASAPVQERLQVVVDGCPVVINFDRYGSGDAIIFLHGWAHNREIWQPVAPLISSRATVVALDLPGFGESPAPDPRLVSISGYALILSEVFRRVEADRPIRAIVADSLAARILLEMIAADIATSPCRFLLSGCPLDGLPPLAVIASSLHLPTLTLEVLRALPRSVSKGLIEIFSSVTVRRRGTDLRPIVDGVLSSTPSVADTLLQELARPATTPKRSSNATFMALGRGQFDHVVSRRTQTRWAPLLGASTVEFHGTGHTPMIEAPEQYAAAVLNLAFDGSCHEPAVEPRL